MTERDDSLHALLGEWKSPEPPPELDARIAAGYRSAFATAAGSTTVWRRFWNARVSMPAPLVAVAVIAVLGLLFWFHATTRTRVLSAADVVTRLDGTGFQPLPNGEARVVSITEIQK